MCVALFSLSAAAQEEGDFAVGAQVTYGFDMEQLGLGVKAQYNFTDPIRGEAQFNYYPKKDYVTCWDIQANVHYLFDVADQFKVYPLVGIGYLHAKASADILGYEVSASDGDLFFNAGGGVQYNLTDNFAIGGELKYQFKDGGQFCLSAGVIYKF